MIGRRTSVALVRVLLVLMVWALALVSVVADADRASAATLPPSVDWVSAGTVRSGPGAAAETAVVVDGAGPGTAPPATTEPTEAPSEQSPVAGGGNTPQPVGRALPPRAQRIGDSLVWLWVMVLLVGGGLAGSFARRRKSVPQSGAAETKSDEAAGK